MRLGVFALCALLAAPAWCTGPDLQAYEDAVLQRQALTLARAALQAWVHGQRPAVPTDLHPALRESGAVFVSLENRRGQVRGCRGTLVPREPSLAQEIVDNVREACARDPLHARVRPSELGDIRIILCIPGQQDTAWAGEVWDAHRYGVLVESGSRAAAMLPWEAPDSQHQIEWGRKRAGLAPGESCRLVRFEAVRFAESWPPRSTRPSQAASPAPAYW